jgi:hypothetical protein
LMPRIEALSMLIRTDEHIKRVDDLVQHFCKEEKGEEDYSNYNSELNKAYEAYRKILYSDRGAYERIYYVINESLTKRNLTHKFESIIGMYDVMVTTSTGFFGFEFSKGRKLSRYQVIKANEPHKFYLLLKAKPTDSLIGKIKTKLAAALDKGDNKNIDVISDNEEETTFIVNDSIKDIFYNDHMFKRFMGMIKDDPDLVGKCEQPKVVGSEYREVKHIPCHKYMLVDGHMIERYFKEITKIISDNRPIIYNYTDNSNSHNTINGSHNMNTNISGDEATLNFIRSNNPRGKSHKEYYDQYSKFVQSPVRKDILSGIIRNLGFEETRKNRGYFWK